MTIHEKLLKMIDDLHQNGKNPKKIWLNQVDANEISLLPENQQRQMGIDPNTLNEKGIKAFSSVFGIPFELTNKATSVEA